MWLLNIHHSCNSPVLPNIALHAHPHTSTALARSCTQQYSPTRSSTQQYSSARSSTEQYSPARSCTAVQPCTLVHTTVQPCTLVHTAVQPYRLVYTPSCALIEGSARSAPPSSEASVAHSLALYPGQVHIAVSTTCRFTLECQVYPVPFNHHAAKLGSRVAG